jgi:hypothetical protein
MKKIYLTVPLAGLLATAAYAAVPTVLSSGGGVNTGQYHSYDGLICTDCHTLHNSEDGATVHMPGYANYGVAYRELLYRGDWSDMCLSCHMQGQNTASTAALPSVSHGVDPVTGIDYGDWTAPIVMTLDGSVPAGVAMPGGDFYYSNLDPKKGHNPSYTKGSMDTPTSLFIAHDPVLGTTPPGGTITDGEWSCHSCHGMHSRFSGSYAPYRQLKRKVNNINQSGCDQTRANGADSTFQDCGVAVTAAGYEAIKSNSRGSYDATLNYVNTRADGNPLEAADLYASESDTNKNVYRGGFSSFCSTCHGDFHGGDGESRLADNGVTRLNNAWIKHPTNVTMDQSTGSKYGINTYQVAILNTQGNNPNPIGYDWKYPLVQPDSNFDVKASVAGGALHTDDRIMCLTCHRAHASKYENMTRWDSNGHAFIAAGEVDFTGETSIGDNPAYGCGKCHQKGGVKAFKKAF